MEEHPVELERERQLARHHRRGPRSAGPTPRHSSSPPSASIRSLSSAVACGYGPAIARRRAPAPGAPRRRARAIAAGSHRGRASARAGRAPAGRSSGSHSGVQGKRAVGQPGDRHGRGRRHRRKWGSVTRATALGNSSSWRPTRIRGDVGREFGARSGGPICTRKRAVPRRGHRPHPGQRPACSSSAQWPSPRPGRRPANDQVPPGPRQGHVLLAAALLGAGGTLGGGQVAQAERALMPVIGGARRPPGRGVDQHVPCRAIRSRPASATTTTSNSRPLAACTVISITACSSSSAVAASPSRDASAACSSQNRMNPSRSGPRSASYSPPAGSA